MESALAGDPCSDPLTNQIYIVYMFIIIIDIYRYILIMRCIAITSCTAHVHTPILILNHE